MQSYSSRFWEIDVLRGIAIIMMIIYHFSYDLYFLAGCNIKIYSSYWAIFQRTTASLFLVLVGISLTISYSRKKNEYPRKKLFLRNTLRGIKIFIWGCLITIFTLIFLDSGTIFFGILHLIGVSIVLSYPFLDYKYKNLIFGISFILISYFLGNFNFNTPYLLWLGFEPESFFSFDYFPLIPWFGVVLIGIFLGNLIYPDGKRIFKISDLSNLLIIKQLSFLGKHSLKIYILHQPIIILILYSLGFADLSFIGI